MNNVIEFKSDKSLEFYVDQLKRVLDSKCLIIAYIKDDNTFGTFIENEIVDIDLCYLIDFLQEQRRERNST